MVPNVYLFQLPGEGKSVILFGGSRERGVRVGRGNGRVHGDEKGFENDGYFASARVGGKFDF